MRILISTYLERVNQKKNRKALGNAIPQTLALTSRVKFPGPSPKFNPADSNPSSTTFVTTLSTLKSRLPNPVPAGTHRNVKPTSIALPRTTLWRQERCPLSLSKLREFLVAQVHCA